MTTASVRLFRCQGNTERSKAESIMVGLAHAQCISAPSVISGGKSTRICMRLLLLATFLDLASIYLEELQSIPCGLFSKEGKFTITYLFFLVVLPSL